MGFYVYRYMHPDHSWLYVGKTNVDLRNRIQTHDTSSSDNIDRKYLDLLLESTVYYIELNSSLQTDYVEKYLIDKYSPLLNIKDKNYNPCALEITLPKWKKLVRTTDLMDSNFINATDKIAVYQKKQELESLRREYLDLEKEIHNIERDLVQKKGGVFAKITQTNKKSNWYVSENTHYKILMDGKYWDKFEFVDSGILVTNVCLLNPKHPEYDFSQNQIDTYYKYVDEINDILDNPNVFWKVEV